MRKKRKTVCMALIMALLLVLSGCTEAEKVSYNVSKEADNFNVTRRLTVINSRTDKCILQMTGKMSLEEVDGGIAVIVELDRDKHLYQKHYIWMNEWTMYTCEDVSGTNVSKYAYEMEFMPQTLLPVRITTNELAQDIEKFIPEDEEK